MAKRVCIEPGCPTLVDQGRCDDHRRERDRARGTRQERGYTAAFEAEGRSIQRRMDAGETFTCWRCHRPVGTRRGTQWVLGHCDINRDVIHGPEHPAENYATAGRTGCPHPSHR